MDGYRPQAQELGLLIESLGDELLVCDTVHDRALVLNATAATVWRACDGQRDLAALQEHCELDRDTVELALEQLRECALLSEPKRSAALSRREILRKGAIVAGLGAMLPVIQAVTVPATAAAAPTAMLTTTATLFTTTAAPASTTSSPATTVNPNLTTTTTTTLAMTTTAIPVAPPTTPAPHHPPPSPFAWIFELLRWLFGR